MNDNLSGADPESRFVAPGGSLAVLIGEWRVDPALDQISSGDKVVKLEPRHMRLLLYLASQAGCVVKLDELLREVWPNLIVTPQSVYNAIAQLRVSLGDSSDVPAYIVTVARKGYRLIADVKPPETPTSPASILVPSVVPPADIGLATTDAPPHSGVAPSSQSARGRRRLIAIGAIAVGLTLAVLTLERQGLWPRSSPPAPVPVGVNEHSIAVLPFLDMSENKDQQYFADGMTEQLINELAQLSSLRVSARTSSFYFKGKQLTVAEISKALRVKTVVEGSVRRVGNQVRITVQLIDTASGFHVWSHAYDRDFKDILEVQSSVATSIAQALNVTLTPDDSAKLTLGGTQNPAAYDAYLRAEQQLLKGNDSEASARAALALFDQTIALDPNYAQAYSGRARTLATLAVFHVDAGARDDVRRQALAAGERAVALAPELGEAYATLAITRAYGLLDFAGAAPEFDRALALAPGNARVQRLYAEFSSALGHHERAVAAARRAVSLDPQNFLSHVTLGRALHHARNDRESLLAFRDAEALKSDSNFIEGNIAGSLIASGQFEQARQHCESKTITLNDDNRHWCLALVYHFLGHQSMAERELAQLKAVAGDEAAFAYAEIYAQSGDAKTALAWLAKAEQLREPSLQSLRVNFLLDPLRSYPEFHAIENRLKLPP
jgi:TolB-like protein/DNA-binding winged helix-turn-helix (wHTH) protein/Tfp pilus assembly protein PilF